MPVDAEPADAPVALKRGLAIVLELRVVGVAKVASGRRHNRRRLGSGEEQELLDLVGADIADDAAGDLAVGEPSRPARHAWRVRPEPGGLDHAANGALSHQLACLDGAAAIPM